jgi:hypothetical protein
MTKQKAAYRMYSKSLPSETGFVRAGLLVLLVIAVGVVGISRLSQSHAAADSPRITNGVSHNCLDDRDNSTQAQALVQSWTCNGTSAQSWQATATTIFHGSNRCLSVLQNSKQMGASVVLETCSGAPGQVWLRDTWGYENPNSGLCLSAPLKNSTGLITTEACSGLSQPREAWALSGDTLAAKNMCSDTEGDKVACAAIHEWTTWQADASDHESLLTSYTGGAAYEEWCADFVSYVYKEAGYPFTQGEADGWDENIAGNIQNMGFSEHSASSGYVPRAGDVAFFSYSGGHVEIVISGGKNPTFIYGNSATVDPTTGNGQMAANTITSDANGEVLYYLSPN